MLDGAEAGRPFLQQIDVRGGQGPYTWNIIEGSLPEGVGLDPVTGTTAGTPYRTGASSFTVEVVDSEDRRSRQLLIATVEVQYERLDEEFAWIDAREGGTRLPIDQDDQAVSVDLPFTFRYFGTPFRKLSVSSNGYLVFGDDQATTFANTNVPNSRNPNGTVAVLWDDLSPQVGGGVWARTTGRFPNRKTVIAWIDAPRFRDYGSGTFEVILEEGTNDIVMQYLDIDFGEPAFNLGKSATIGIESVDGTAGIEISYNDTLPDPYIGGVAIRFSDGFQSWPTMNTRQLQQGALSRPYVDILSARAGNPPLAWSLLSGSLPPGLALDSRTGMITGVPSEAGDFTFNVKATDSSHPEWTIISQHTLKIVPEYFMSDGPYKWIDARDDGGRLEFPADASAMNITLPFPFTYFGALFDEVLVSSHGYLSFGSRQITSPTNTSIPNPAQPNGVAAALWDSFSPGSGQGVWVRTIGDAPNRRLVVSWIDVAHFNQIGAARFQVLLEEGTDRIIFQYQDINFNDERFDNGASATVGLESPAGTIGVEFSFNTPMLGPYRGAASLVYTPLKVEASASDRQDEVKNRIRATP